MSAWGSEVIRWFTLAEQHVGAALKLIGQDNEVVTLGVVALISLLTLSLIWMLFLGLLRGVVGLFGGGSDRSGAAGDLRREGFVFAGAPERGRLDVVPSAAVKTRPLAAAPKIREPEVTPTPEIRAPKSPAPRTRLSEAAGGNTDRGALPIRPGDDLQQIQLRELPRLSDRGRVVSARPEWTGRVVPSSLQAAGAVEICKVLSRRPPALAGNETVRAVDYRVCGLPRVDGEGRRQPDVLVYTVADRGFLPKGAPAKQSRRS
jgi:hypothetical protein